MQRDLSWSWPWQRGRKQQREDMITDSGICPVTALLAYLAIQPPSPGSLFVYSNGSPLTRYGCISGSCSLVWDWYGPLRLHRPQFQDQFGYLCHSSWSTWLSGSNTIGPLEVNSLPVVYQGPTDTFLFICRTLVHACATQQGQTRLGYNTA